jgi:hypothetical protein
VKWDDIASKYKDALVADLCERSASYRRVSSFADKNHLHDEANQCKEMADAIDCAVDLLLGRPAA